MSIVTPSLCVVTAGRNRNRGHRRRLCAPPGDHRTPSITLQSAWSRHVGAGIVFRRATRSRTNLRRTHETGNAVAAVTFERFTSSTLPVGKGFHAVAPGLTSWPHNWDCFSRFAPSAQDQEDKFDDCPAAVRVSLFRQRLCKSAKIETVTKETGDDDQTVFWAEVKLDGRPYAIGVLEDGTLSELNLAVDDAEVTLELQFGRQFKRPAATSRSARKLTALARTWK